MDAMAKVKTVSDNRRTYMRQRVLGFPQAASKREAALAAETLVRERLERHFPPELGWQLGREPSGTQVTYALRRYRSSILVRLNVWQVEDTPMAAVGCAIHADCTVDTGVAQARNLGQWTGCLLAGPTGCVVTGLALCLLISTLNLVAELLAEAAGEMAVAMGTLILLGGGTALLIWLIGRAMVKVGSFFERRRLQEQSFDENLMEVPALWDAFTADLDAAIAAASYHRVEDV